ncbi:MAG: sulfotransferase [Myxococcota bacterium]|nr:sulfotransferase [Myxococcota bacterium]
MRIRRWRSIEPAASPPAHPAHAHPTYGTGTGGRPLRPASGARRHRPRRSLLVRTAIGAGELALRSGLYRPDFSPARLIRAAQRRTGLEEFGDGFSVEGLRRLLRSYETEARLHAVGRIAAHADTLALLSNRLRLVADRRRHPEIAEQAIERPVFIVGLPRTGTTLLHRLLAQDPAHRVPHTWEILHPSPPPQRARAATDARIARAARGIRQLDRLAPQFQRIHAVGARLPEECIAILAHSFASDRFVAMHRLPSYQAWLDQQDLRFAYADHRRFLQQLQWRHPGRRWLLKAPAHLLALDDLLAVYPDALIVQTHRDPVRILASLASLVATLRGAFSDDVDPVEIGRDVAVRWAEALRRSIAVRQNVSGDRFVDIQYRDLLRDPIAIVRLLYARMDTPLDAETERAMQRFLEANPQDRFGRHRYPLAPFGLDGDAERRRYARYRTHFQVPDEDAAQAGGGAAG